MLLEPIYEEQFFDFSYGFRPGRSAHQALQRIWKQIMDEPIQWIVEVDIRKFFDTLDHNRLREVLRQRVTDGVITKLIDKWLNAGVLEQQQLTYPEEGTPQGGVISPIISNVFLHEVLDKWFEQIGQTSTPRSSIPCPICRRFCGGLPKKRRSGEGLSSAASALPEIRPEVSTQKRLEW